MKSIWATLFCLSIGHVSLAYNVDSLFEAAKDMEAKERMLLYNKIAFQEINGDPGAAVQIANAAMMEGQQLKDPANIGQALYTMAYAQRKMGLIPYSLNHSIEAADQYFILEDSMMANRCMMIAGLAYYDIGFERTSARVFKRAKEYYDTIDEKLESARAAYYLARSYNSFKGQMLSVPLLEEAILVFDSLGKQELGLEARHLLAQSHDFMDSVLLADKAYRDAIDFAKSMGSEHLSIPMGLNYALFTAGELPSKALPIARTYLEIARKKGRRRQIRAALDTLSIILIKDNQNREAVEVLQESIELAELDACKECLVYEYKAIAQAYAALGEHEKAYTSMTKYDAENLVLNQEKMEDEAGNTRDGFYASDKEEDLAFEREQKKYALQNPQEDATVSFVRQNARLLIFGAFLLISLGLVSLMRRPVRRRTGEN